MNKTDLTNQYTLPVGTVLKNRYCIAAVLGIGGFGITYKVLDRFTQREFAVKEYAPAKLCMRDEDGVTLKPLYEEKLEALNHGKQRFLEEADLLRQLDDIAGIVPVMDCFNENNTSYFVMDYVEGITLSEQLQHGNGRLGIGETLSIIGSVAYALDRVHAQKGVLHRDVSPDNILITSNNDIRVIDFGNARHLMNDENQQYSIVLKPGFAPPEQYSSKAVQGTYTDVYSLAGTMYFCLTGMMIPAAPERLNGEDYISLKEIFPQLTQSFSDAVDRALILDYHKRTVDMVSFMDELGLDPTLYEDKVSFFPYLEILSGKNKGQRIKLLKNTCLTIGRSRKADIVLRDNLYISKKHCEIFFDAKEKVFYIEDYSRNGTYIDHQRIESRTLTEITSDQQFSIGDQSIVMKVGVMYV